MDAEIEYESFSNLTNIQSFFRGQSVFLTGVTGLVGKVLLEKLLRCCPGIGMIYVLMRSKRNLTAEQRMDKLFKLELFREVKKVYPLFWKKVKIIEGDITKPKLGISFEDIEKIQQNVSIVIHSAASVNFNDPIKFAVEYNVIPTQRVLEMCHKMPHLKVLVHISTAYVNREEDGSVFEEIYKCKVNPFKLMDALEWLDEKSQASVEKFLLEDERGNLTTYLVTKALAEELIREKRGDLPMALVRPCYISPTCRDPFPGWIDTIQGISGLMLAGAKGVLRTLHTVDDLKINIIPVDIVVNSIITSAWHVGTTRPATPFIMNCVMDYKTLPDADEKILKFTLDKRNDYPLVNIFRYPDFTYYHNYFVYQIHATIDQWIPALIIDLFLFIFTGKTILVKVYSKINFLYGIFYRLSKDPWICRIDNYLALRDRLSEEDEKIFFMNLDNFDWEEYMDNCFQGGRKFLAREDPSNIPYAKKKMKVWWTVTTTMKWLLICFFLYYVFPQSFLQSLYKTFQDLFYSR